MKRLLFTLLVTICAAIAFEGKAAYSRLVEPTESLDAKSKIVILTKSGHRYNAGSTNKCADSEQTYPSINHPENPYWYFSSTAHVKIEYAMSSSSTRSALGIYAGNSTMCTYYVSSIKDSNGYSQFVWKSGANELTAWKYANSYVKTYQVKDSDGYRYIECVYKDITYELRYIDGGAYIVPISEEMPGERFYLGIDDTGEDSKIHGVVTYEDGFKISSDYPIAITTDDLATTSISFANALDTWDEDIILDYTVSAVDENYYTYDENSQQITLSSDIPDGTELKFKLQSKLQYHPESKRLLAAASATKSIVVSNDIKKMKWVDGNNIPVLDNTLDIFCRNDYSTTARLNPLSWPLSETGKYEIDKIKIQLYYLDENGKYTNDLIPGLRVDSYYGGYSQVSGSVNFSEVASKYGFGFGNCPLTQKYATTISYITGNPNYSADDKMIGIGRGPDLTVDIRPSHLSVEMSTGLSEGKMHADGEGIAISFDMMPHLYKTIRPDWGTWTAKITPAFEKKDQASLEAEYEWAHKNDDFADKWWEETFDYDKEYICSFDTKNYLLLIPEFTPTCSGVYHITLHASPMKEGYPYPFPIKDTTWDFDFNYYPDHTDIELATRTPYSDNWEWSSVNNGSTWYGPSDKIPERAEAWKHLSVKPKGGYVDVWYKDISTGSAKKVAPTAGPARAAASPETEGYTKMDGNYIDASNMNRLSLMLSKNGAVNPNTINVNLARLDETQTGVESIDAATSGTAEYYHIDGRRAEGTLAPGLYIKTQDGRSSKVIVR